MVIFCTRTVIGANTDSHWRYPFPMTLVCISNSLAGCIETVHCLPGQAQLCTWSLKRFTVSVSWPNANRWLANYYRQFMLWPQSARFGLRRDWQSSEQKKSECKKPQGQSTKMKIRKSLVPRPAKVAWERDYNTTVSPLQPPRPFG